MNRFLVTLTLLASLSGCSSDPAPSYCEAVCENAVACNEAERTLDSETAMADCLAATEALDDNCAKATNGELNPATKKLSDTCVTSIQDQAGECDAFTGRIDAIKTGTTTADCLAYNTGAQDVFDAARDATAETGEDLCNRFPESFCALNASCLEEQLGDSLAGIAEQLGYTPYDRCLSQLEDQTNTCISEDDYALEESLTDANATRQGARECLAEFDAITCDDLFGGNYEAFDPGCAAAVADPANYYGVIVDIATEFIEAETGR